jgi:hypothetical protein
MVKKLDTKVKRLWQELQDAITPTDASNLHEILNVVKFWIMERQNLLGSYLQRSPALSLLLSGEFSEFPMSIPLAGENIRDLILSDFYPPRDIEHMTKILEEAIREFLVFTRWEDCPACNEGYLGYWIEPTSKTLVLKCPECWWEQDIEGNQWTSPLALMPASMQDLQDLQEVSTGE